MVDRAVLTGAGGFLASEILAQKSDVEIVPLLRAQLDIADARQVQECLAGLKPKFLINCAAYRDIDKAEADRATARRINVEGPKVLAEACARFGVKLLHFGTHGIFGGDKSAPYVESDEPGPVNYYGATKWEGEREALSRLPPDLCLVIRISWPYGSRGNNFIHAIFQAARTRPEVRVVSDHTGTPNPASLLAKQVLALLREGSGVFHLSCKGSCSRFELIELLFQELKVPCRVVPVPAEAFPTVAPRPRHIAIATEVERLDRLAPMPSWQEGVFQFLKDHREDLYQ